MTEVKMQIHRTGGPVNNVMLWHYLTILLPLVVLLKTAWSMVYTSAGIPSSVLQVAYSEDRP